MPDRVSIPAVEALATTNPRETSFMQYFDAKREGPAARCEVREWTPLADIAPLFVALAVKGEDLRFFDHHGVNWQATAFKTFLALQGRYIGGASTITQQLARNLYLTPSRSIVRKLREMRLALRIERALSKTRILELYLNLIEFGPDVWGVTAASRHYFGKAPRDLDLFESSFLIVLLPAPKAGPIGRHAARCHHGQRLLAYRMFAAGLVSAEDCATCCDRVEHLHRLLADGTGLLAALSSSRGNGAEAVFLRDMAASLDIVPIPPSDVLASRCGYEQERITFERLHARFGQEPLRQALRAANLSALRT